MEDSHFSESPLSTFCKEENETFICVYILLLSVCVLVCVCVSHMYQVCAGTHAGQRRVLDSLDLKS